MDNKLDIWINSVNFTILSIVFNLDTHCCESHYTRILYVHHRPSSSMYVVSLVFRLSELFHWSSTLVNHTKFSQLSRNMKQIATKDIENKVRSTDRKMKKIKPTSTYFVLFVLYSGWNHSSREKYSPNSTGDPLKDSLSSPARYSLLWFKLLSFMFHRSHLSRMSLKQ